MSSPVHLLSSTWVIALLAPRPELPRQREEPIQSRELEEEEYEPSPILSTMVPSVFLLEPSADQLLALKSEQKNTEGIFNQI